MAQRSTPIKIILLVITTASFLVPSFAEQSKQDKRSENSAAVQAPAPMVPPHTWMKVTEGEAPAAPSYAPSKEVVESIGSALREGDRFVKLQELEKAEEFYIKAQHDALKTLPFPFWGTCKDGLWRLCYFYLYRREVGNARRAFRSIASRNGLFSGSECEVFFSWLDQLDSRAFDEELNYLRNATKSGKQLSWGFIDKQGRFVIPPQFKNASYFNQDFASVETAAGTGYIAKDGRWELRPRFTRAHKFSEGLAAASSIEYKFKLPRNGDEWEQFAIHLPAESDFGYIDHSGKFVIAPQFYGGSFFSEGLATIRCNEISPGGSMYVGSKYIDRTGKFVSPSFLYAESFRNGVAEVTVPVFNSDPSAESSRNRHPEKVYTKLLYKVSDTSELAGVLFPRPMSSSASINFNYICVAQGITTQAKNSEVQPGGANLFGFVDLYGAWVIKPTFDLASYFSEGLAPVMVQSKWGYIDKQGAVVIPPQFEEAHAFKNGAAVVQKDGLYGVIDKSGRSTTGFKFDMLDSFSEGLAAASIAPSKGIQRKIVECDLSVHRQRNFIENAFDQETNLNLFPYAPPLDCRIGFIDSSGNFVIPPQFTDVHAFNDGLAAVEKHSKWGFIDKTGRFSVKPHFAYVRDFSEGLAAAGTGGQVIQRTTPHRLPGHDAPP